MFAVREDVHSSLKSLGEQTERVTFAQLVAMFVEPVVQREGIAQVDFFIIVDEWLRRKTI